MSRVALNYTGEELDELKRRLAELEKLQAAFPRFRDFLPVVIEDMLGFVCSDIQIDIADYVAEGPLYRMIQAQRGQAKTTITAAYAVWRLIHNPSTRILVCSAGEEQASEVAGWITQILRRLPILRCLQPARSDRQAAGNYDVHYLLKGPEKSPSVACVPIMGNMQGKRADVFIADDVESSKNARTAAGRELIQHLMQDFTSMCSTGDIIYLGTPQSVDSVYNELPSRGYDVRIWPGRYPTVSELDNYGDMLAPLILERLQKDPSLQTGGGIDGKRGKPTDPVLMNEYHLTKKELNQGPAYFQLQFMLDTRLADQERFPLKLSYIGFMHLTGDTGPVNAVIAPTTENLIKKPAGCPVHDNLYRVQSTGNSWQAYSGTHMFIDPGGGGENGDETGWAVSKYLLGKVHIFGVGGVKGGYEESVLDELIDIMIKFNVQWCDVEDNYGNGAFRKILQARLLQRNHACRLEPIWNTGQKELRIIDTLQPIISNKRMIMNEQVIHDDIASLAKYPQDKRKQYSFLFQLSRITRVKGSLAHEDRLEALEGTCRHWIEDLDADSDRILSEQRQEEIDAQIAKTLGHPNEETSKMLVRGRPVPQANRRMDVLRRSRRHG